ncbi:MAG TPA: hypothetical protein VJZ70_05430 [Limnochordia bacterium]|nr:hypothetical protein [Limnochordia bacterium]
MRELWNRLNERQKKVFSWLAVALIAGVGMLLLQPTTPVEVPITLSSETPKATTNSGSTKEALEKELTLILNAMLGGKRTNVFLTMERGPSLKIAYDITEEERWGDGGLMEKRWTSNPVLMRNDADRKEVPLVLEENEPIVRGVLVVVDQEPRTDLQLAISQAVATALQVPMYRIEVLFKQ